MYQLLSVNGELATNGAPNSSNFKIYLLYLGTSANKLS